MAKKKNQAAITEAQAPKPEPTKYLLRLGEHTFECKDRMPRYALLNVAVAEATGEEMNLVKATVDFLMAIVLPAERNRLHDLLMENDELFDQMEDALDTLMEQYTGNGGGEPESSPPSSAGTKQISRVVSFSQGTVEVAEDETTS